ncbi:CopD family protein [Luteipulveratus mongoliensis]|uniref:Copper resistance protein D domain-containing protein n=1 Tax=Luteipulveratus mongoliensis TaxID=571913 RepID=A0A0K1JNF1_9MICO|nr:CopD family protein [Luteipulveratus mongoliensis]AKU18239.1 hypothetical protein VV02_24260 [Luteipulveratus mongoliensis]
MTSLTVGLGDEGLRTAIVGMARVLSYLGFVILVGITFFITWLWPEGRVLWVFYRLLQIGAVLTFVSSAVIPVLVATSGWASYGGREGACALTRMALVAIGYAFIVDVLNSSRHHRLLISAWQFLIVETYVLGSDAWGGVWAPVKVIATTYHLYATAAWLGGLLALAAVLIPSTSLEVLHGVLPRFSIVAIVSVITLTVTGVLHALVVAGGVSELVDSSYGTVLMIKIVVFAVMLLLGNIGRSYAARIGKRKVTDIDDATPPESVQAFAVAIGAEFALAVGVLTATAALVHVVPK